MIAIPTDHLDANAVGPRCLVTGAAGYLGRLLVSELERLGCTVVATDREPGDGITPLDITDRAAVLDRVREVDVVYHCAARMAFAGLAPPSVVAAMHAVNVDGTRHVLEACRANGVGRLVHISSTNVCIDGPVHEQGEETPYASKWVDLYGPTKALGEQLVLEAADDQLRTVALRPGGLWGPGRGGHMVETFLAQLAWGRMVATIGNGKSYADNTHTSTLIHAMLNGAWKLGTQPEKVNGRPFFVTDDERINGMRWFKPIADGLGVPWPTRTIPVSLAYAVAWLGEVGHRLGLPEPDITRIGVVKLTCSTAFSVDAAREALDWSPLVSSADGLHHHLPTYAEVYREYGGHLP